MFDWLKNDLDRRSYTVGWTIEPRPGGLVWGNPESITRDNVKSRSPKAVTRCPAVIDLEARYFMIRCPFDLAIRLEQAPDGQVRFQNINGIESTLNANALAQIFSVSGRDQWRHPKRPIIQISTPYRFLTDDKLYISQLPPFLYYQKNAWPGVLFSGRFPLDVWPRALMWAFEWHDVEKPLIIQRGEPWFMVYFEAPNPDKKIKLVEAERTPEFLEYSSQIDGVTSLVNQTFSLFKLGWKRRPKKLLVPKQR